RRPPHRHHRGLGAERPAPPRPEGLCRGRRPAVRLLHAGHDHGIGGAAPAQGGPDRAGDRPRARRPHLPVRYVRPHRPRGAAGGRGDEGRRGMSEARPPSRDPLEPERYELDAGPAYRFDVDRREFVKLLGGGLVVMAAAATAPAQESGARGGGAASPPREIAAGKHRYTSDLTRPGLWHGRVVRPPAIGATLVSLDDAGVDTRRVSVVHDGDFVGVSAPTAAEAALAAGRLKAEWKTSPQPSDAQIFEYRRKTPPEPRDGDGRGPGAQVSGSVDSARAAAPLRLEQTYTVAYIAHAPLEPRAALAEWQDGRLTVWTGTQRPFGVRTELA